MKGKLIKKTIKHKNTAYGSKFPSTKLQKNILRKVSLHAWSDQVRASRYHLMATLGGRIFGPCMIIVLLDGYFFKC